MDEKQHLEKKNVNNTTMEFEFVLTQLLTVMNL